MERKHFNKIEEIDDKEALRRMVMEKEFPSTIRYKEEETNE